MKTWATTVTIVLTLIVSFSAVIGGCSVIAWRKDVAAKRFCESLIPNIEAVKEKSGRYPAAVDATWWSGKSVPPLIRTQRFYSVRSDGFGFYFQNDMWFFNNAWSFEIGRGWDNYDATFERY